MLIYGCSVIYSVFLLRRGFREDNLVNYLVLALGFGFHTCAIMRRGLMGDRCPTSNLYEATMFVDWVMVATYLVLGVVRRLRFLGAFASPVIFALGVFALMPSLDAPYHREWAQYGPTSVHAALILLAYGAFGLAAVAGAMFLSQEHDLKFHKARAIFSLMPPIQRQEAIVQQLLIAGFALLSAGLVVSAFWMKPPPGVALHRDFKVLWTVLVWALYLGLLILRWRFHQRGRRFAWGAVGTFAFVLLTFWGANLASNIHHPLKP